MDWEVVLPKLHAALVAGGFLALAARVTRAPWEKDMGPIIARFSTNTDYRAFDLVAELERRQLFRLIGRVDTPAGSFRQSLDGYVESIHSRNGFSRDRMDAGAAQAFDNAVREMLAPHSKDGFMEFEVSGLVTWGLPLASRR
jgi:hypothetical protein